MHADPLRILLAEDVHMLRGALAALLELEPDFRVVAQVDRGDDIIPTALSHSPDVAVIDIGLPGMDGISAAAQLRERLPSCKTLILTGTDNRGTLRRCLEVGVGGLMLKCAPADSLAKAVRDVAAGHQVVDPQIALAAMSEESVSPLSLRETQILQLTANGCNTNEIAGMLHLSPGTVRNYLTSIVTKLNARTKVDAVRIAFDAGWLT